MATVHVVTMKSVMSFHERRVRVGLGACTSGV